MKKSKLDVFFISIITCLLAVISYFSYAQIEAQKEMAKNFNVLHINNTKEHIIFKQELKEWSKWTYEIYKNRIIPTENRSRDNEKEILIIKERIK